MPDRLACSLTVDGKNFAPHGIQIWAYRKNLSQSQRADVQGPYVFERIEIRVSIAIFSKRSEAQVASLLAPLFNQLGIPAAIGDMARALKAGKNEYGAIWEDDNKPLSYFSAKFVDGGRDFFYGVYW